jgi:hypothetical protein
MVGCRPPPMRHNTAPAPASLPEEFLLAPFVLVRRDGTQPPGVRAVNTFLSPADRQENGKVLHSLTQAGKDTGGHRAGTAAVQGTPRCADATCPGGTTATAATRVAGTGDLHASADYATIGNINIIIRPAASQHPAADMTQPLSLLPQSLGGTCGGVPSVPEVFPPAHHMIIPNV